MKTLHIAWILNTIILIICLLKIPEITEAKSLTIYAWWLFTNLLMAIEN